MRLRAGAVACKHTGRFAAKRQSRNSQNPSKMALTYDQFQHIMQTNNHNSHANDPNRKKQEKFPIRGHHIGVLSSQCKIGMIF